MLPLPTLLNSIPADSSNQVQYAKFAFLRKADVALQWFPGHMHKALKEIKESLSQVDILIEVLDARIPYSSENPEIAKIRGDKPCLKILEYSTG